VSDTRLRILDAAARLISQNGFAQTTVDDVISAAGLSGKSHFYHHFKSKEALGYGVLDRTFERFTERGLAMLREPMIEPADRLALFIESIATLAEEREGRGGSPFGAWVSEVADSHEGFRTRLDAMFDRWSRQIQSLLWELRPQMRAGVDEARLANFIIAALEGGMLLAKVKRSPAVMHAIGDDLKRFVATHLTTGAESLERPTVNAQAGATEAGAPRPAAIPAGRGSGAR
jgi:TetR/AcrR family transcriptional regulator, transcriptional repressor for nem operon